MPCAKQLLGHVQDPIECRDPNALPMLLEKLRHAIPAPVWNRFHPAVPFLKGSYPASTKISQFRCLPSETLV